MQIKEIFEVTSTYIFYLLSFVMVCYVICAVLKKLDFNSIIKNISVGIFLGTIINLWSVYEPFLQHYSAYKTLPYHLWTWLYTGIWIYVFCFIAQEQTRGYKNFGIGVFTFFFGVSLLLKITGIETFDTFDKYSASLSSFLLAFTGRNTMTYWGSNSITNPGKDPYFWIFGSVASGNLATVFIFLCYGIVDDVWLAHSGVNIIVCLMQLYAVFLLFKTKLIHTHLWFLLREVEAGRMEDPDTEQEQNEKGTEL